MQVLADLLLPLGRHTLEFFVILKEVGLLLGRHLAKFLRPLPRQLSGIGICAIPEIGAAAYGIFGRMRSVFVGILTGPDVRLRAISIHRRTKSIGRMRGIRRLAIRVGCGVGCRTIRAGRMKRIRRISPIPLMSSHIRIAIRVIGGASGSVRMILRPGRRVVMRRRCAGVVLRTGRLRHEPQ